MESTKAALSEQTVVQNLDESSLHELAMTAAAHAYAPYSGFRVGAAIVLTNGSVVTGANVENVSYGLTICAERSAIVRAIAEFGPEIHIAAVEVVNLNNAPSPPCGACRQVLAEFIAPDAYVTFPAHTHSGVAAITLPFRDLLPHAFDLQLK